MSANDQKVQPDPFPKLELHDIFRNALLNNHYTLKFLQAERNSLVLSNYFPSGGRYLSNAAHANCMMISTRQ